MKILHFADLHLGVENYGHIDPTTGLSSRLHDFLSAFDHLIDYAVENDVDLVLFCGDAYKSREPSQTQQREFARRINRLSTSGIPTFLLIGNHDLPNAFGRATTTEIFHTLAVQNIHVANRPDIHRIHTRNGTIQVVSLPWLRRSSLLRKEDIKNLDFEQINQQMQQTLTNIIATTAARIDPSLPSILAAHVWVAPATPGSERLMTIGQEHALLLSNVANPAFDYVALGHIHRHQVLSDNPPVIYSGSLSRLDFGEEEGGKGFYVVEIQPDGMKDKRTVSFEFHPVIGRRFLTISLTLEQRDTNPTDTILAAINEQGDKIKDAIVRLQISLPAEVEAQLRDNEIRDALKEAHFFSIARDIKRETRLRLGTSTVEELTPVEALKKYLETQNVSAERTRLLLEYGEKLIRGQETEL